MAAAVAVAVATPRVSHHPRQANSQGPSPCGPSNRPEPELDRQPRPGYGRKLPEPSVFFSPPPAKRRQMGVRGVHEALGIYTHDVHRRWGSVFWLNFSWARVIRGRLPVIGRPNADIIHHGPPPAYAHTARGTAERLLAGPRRGRRCTPASVVRGARAAAGLCVSGGLAGTGRADHAPAKFAFPRILGLTLVY